jgi:Cellulase (glycosyl hydrolase family 5)
MRQLVRGSFIFLAAMVVLVTGASGARKAATVKTSSGGLDTAIFYTPLSSNADTATALERIQAAGAKYVAIHVYWSNIAPSGTTKPDGFQASDPTDPHYRWADADNEIKAAVAAGLKPMLFITKAPDWAEGSGRGTAATGTYKPSASELATFVTAAATRYSGSFDGLPRVQYWAVWNEPNLNTFLSPQAVKKKAFSPNWYRSMLNAATDAIHGVNSSNVVIAGETAPFGSASATRDATMPIAFMENVLCVKEKKSVKKVVNKKTHKTTKVVTYSYKSACKTKTKFDVWAHHPYTQGGPTTKAKLHGNASLGDMGEMRSVLNAALKANHVVSSQKPRLWVTEFSWDSKPPDPKGVPIGLETRWVSQMLYEMYSSGVSLVTWFLLRDEPLESSRFQSGLYYAGSGGISSDRAKTTLRAFRFPFVAMPETVNGKTKVALWGRTPTSKSGKVVIERKSGSKWKKVKTLSANSYGIFKARIAKPANTKYLRARLSDGSDQSAEFALATPKKSWKGKVFGVNT